MYVFLSKFKKVLSIVRLGEQALKREVNRAKRLFLKIIKQLPTSSRALQGIFLAWHNLYGRPGLSIKQCTWQCALYWGDQRFNPPCL